MTATPTRADSTIPLPSSAEGVVGALHGADFDLARRIVAGDLLAWTAFVERYAGLILAMIRRYLRSQDRDDIRSIFVNVIDSVRRTRLKTYRGRASLATWLTLVTRSEVMDHLRRRFGRDLKLKALERLSPEEKRLFRLYYIEGQTMSEVTFQLSHEGQPWSQDRFIAALHDIERKLGDRWLRRLSYDLHAQSIGAASGRLLEYLDHVREEFEQRAGSSRPEYFLMEREARQTVEQLRTALAELEPEDRRVLELRFEQGWTARRIADELGMNGQRSVYSTIERIVSRLRRQLGRKDEIGNDHARRYRESRGTG